MMPRDNFLVSNMPSTYLSMQHMLLLSSMQTQLRLFAATPPEKPINFVPEFFRLPVSRQCIAGEAQYRLPYHFSQV